MGTGNGGMRLISAERLRAFVGPGPGNMSARALAAQVGCHPSFIDHLLSGRCWSCSRDRAVAIATAIGMDVRLLFRHATEATGQDSQDVA